MITIDQAMRGVMRFADAEIGPHLPTGKAIGLGVALSLITEGGKEQLIALRENPLIKRTSKATSTSTDSITPPDRSSTDRNYRSRCR